MRFDLSASHMEWNSELTEMVNFPNNNFPRPHSEIPIQLSFQYSVLPSMSEAN